MYIIIFFKHISILVLYFENNISVVLLNALTSCFCWASNTWLNKTNHFLIRRLLQTHFSSRAGARPINTSGHQVAPAKPSVSLNWFNNILLIWPRETHSNRIITFIAHVNLFFSSKHWIKSALYLLLNIQRFRNDLN